MGWRFRVSWRGYADQLTAISGPLVVETQQSIVGVHPKNVQPIASTTLLLAEWAFGLELKRAKLWACSVFSANKGLELQVAILAPVYGVR